jgi:hypothetical protein
MHDTQEPTAFFISTEFVQPGEDLTLWTVRGALALYVLALALRITTSGSRSWLQLSRLLWTVGFAAFLVHVLCAFHFYHGWSHRAAYEATARQTAEVTGLDWGGGIYFNYAFAAVWFMDVAWWWGWPERYVTRPAAIEWAVQGFLAFIAFNATVVFGTRAVRWAGMAACLLLVTLACYRWLADLFSAWKRDHGSGSSALGT